MLALSSALPGAVITPADADAASLSLLVHKFDADKTQPREQSFGVRDNASPKQHDSAEENVFRCSDKNHVAETQPALRAI